MHVSSNNNILMMDFKSMHRWNPLCKGFILSHFHLEGYVVWVNIEF